MMKKNGYKFFSYMYQQDHQRWGYSTVERFEQRNKKKKSDKTIF